MHWELLQIAGVKTEGWYWIELQMAALGDSNYPLPSIKRMIIGYYGNPILQGDFMEGNSKKLVWRFFGGIPVATG